MWNKRSIFYVIVVVFVSVAFLNIITLRDFFVEKFIKETTKVIDQELANKLNATSAMALTIAQSSDAIDFLKAGGGIVYFKRLPHYYNRYTKFKNIKIYVLNRRGNIIFSPMPKKRYKKITVPIDVGMRVFNDTWIDCRGLHLISFATVFDYGQHAKPLGYIAVESQFNSIVKNLQKLGIESIAVLDKELGEMSKDLGSSLDGYKILNYSWDRKFANILKRIGVEKIIHAQKPLTVGMYVYYRYPIRDREGLIDGWLIFSTSLKKLFLDFISPKVIFENVLLVLSFILLIYYHEKSKRILIEEQARYYHQILDDFNETVLIFKGEKIVYFNKSLGKYIGKNEEIDRVVEEIGKSWKPCIVHNDKEICIDNWKEFVSFVCGEKEKILKIVIGNQNYFFQIKSKLLKNSECVAIFVDISQTYRNMEKLQAIAYKDHLTGAFNRNLLQDIFTNLIKMKQKDEHILFVLIDVDHFKKINDTYGHDVGDKVLQYIVKKLKRNLRSEDYIFRFGGEEFLILMKTQNVEKVLQLLDKIRQEIATEKLDFLKNPVTISIGMSEYHSFDTFESALKRADEALYEAKNSGRNRLIFKGVKNDR